MKIAVDTMSLATETRNSGIHVYAFHVLQQIRRLCVDNSSLEVIAFRPERTANRISELPPRGNFCHVIAPSLDNQRKWKLWGMMKAANAARPDVVFLPLPQVLPITRKPVVTTVFDTSSVRIRSQFSRYMSANLRTYMWIAAKLSDRILTISQQSKQDIVDLYQVPESKVSVTYLGIDRDIFNRRQASGAVASAIRSRLKLSRAYLFHHGTIQPRKNLVRLIKAHRLMLERHPDLHLDLVLAGAKGWLCDPTFEEARRTNSSRGSVVFTGPLPDAELAALLKQSELAVIPSMYEGFCFPMVEAMACGVPAVVSNSSCFPEVSCDVLRYFDPGSVEEMAETIYSVLIDSTERRRLAEHGFEASRRYDWTRCAEQTVQALAEACGMTVMPSFA